jgi:hypothetical protein
MALKKVTVLSKNIPRSKEPSAGSLRFVASSAIFTLLESYDEIKPEMLLAVSNIDPEFEPKRRSALHQQKLSPDEGQKPVQSVPQFHNPFPAISFDGLARSKPPSPFPESPRPPSARQSHVTAQ